MSLCIYQYALLFVRPSLSLPLPFSHTQFFPSSFFAYFLLSFLLFFLPPFFLSLHLSFLPHVHVISGPQSHFAFQLNFTSPLISFQFLSGLATECSGASLNPNELRAVIAIVQTIAIEDLEGNSSETRGNKDEEMR